MLLDTKRLTQKLKSIQRDIEDCRVAIRISQAAYFGKQFVRFGSLSGDLRQLIWDIVLEDETDGRLVVFDDWDGAIVPTMNLIPSPLLSINGESRARAQAFYSTKINVYKRYSDAHWASLMEQGDYATFSTLEESWNKEDDTYRAGILYLNLERDLFAHGFGSIYDYNIGTRVRRLHSRLSTLSQASNFFRSSLPLPNIVFPHGPYYSALRFTTLCLPKEEFSRCLSAVYFQSNGRITQVCNKLLPYPTRLLRLYGIHPL
jgi:hypothetical protein